MQIQNIKLDFCRNDYRAITVKQYDAGSRHVLITCTNNDSVYKLDSSTQKCNVKMMTPDNRAIWDDKCVSITDDGKVLVTFTENMVMANGTGQLEIQVIEKATYRELSTMILTVIIVGSVYSNDTIIASDEFNILTDVLKEIEDAVEAAKNVNDIIDNINELESDVEASEAARKSAEATRQANEANRQSSTSTAISNTEKAIERANASAVSAENAAAIANAATNEARDALEKVNDIAEIIRTTEGNSIVINNSVDTSFQSLHLYGKSKQFSTTGAQLANLPDKDEFVVQGITWSCKNGAVAAKGTATAASNSSAGGIGYDVQIVADTYILSGTSSTINVLVKITKSDDTIEYFSSGQPFSLSGSEKQCRVFCQVSSGKTVDATIYPMLNKGSVVLPFEPFTGGKASPNPEYPQDIVSAGKDRSIEVSVCGGNLFDGRGVNHTEGGITILGNNDTITFSGTSEDDRWAKIGDVSLHKGTYTARAFVNDITLTRGVMLQFSNDGFVTIHNPMKLNYGDAYTFSIDDNCDIRLYVGTSAGKNLTNMTLDFMLNVGAEALPYEPYKVETLAVLTPNGLPAIKVTDQSLATYTDENGDMWCADEIDYERGVYIQRIGHRIFDGYESWYTGSSEGTYYVAIRDAIISESKVRAMCSHYRWHGVAAASMENGTFKLTYSNSGDYEYLAIKNTDIATLYEFKQIIAQNPIELTYVLASPIRTLLSADEIKAYKDLMSNSPTTTIINSDDIHMKADIVTGSVGGDVAEIVETEIDKVRSEFIPNNDVIIRSNTKKGFKAKGWYRVAKLIGDDTATARGAWCNSAEIIIKRGYNNTTSEYHHIFLASRYYNSLLYPFVSYCHDLSTHLFTKIRQVVDPTSAISYLELYYDSDVANHAVIQLLNTNTIEGTHWEAADIELAQAQEDLGDLELLAQMDIPLNCRPATDLDLGKGGGVDSGDILDSMLEINANTEADKIAGALAVKELGESIIQHSESRSIGTPNQAGWYRIAKLNAGSFNKAMGSAASSAEIILKRDYQNNESEYHRILFRQVYYNSEFVPIEAKNAIDGSHILMKLRHVVDTTNGVGYIDLYYRGDVHNAVSVQINDAVSVYDSVYWEAVSPVLASEDIGDMTLCTEVDLPTNCKPATDLDLADYLPLIGGNIKGTIEIDGILYVETVEGVWFTIQTAAGGRKISMISSDGMFGFYDDTHKRWIMRSEGGSDGRFDIFQKLYVNEKQVATVDDLAYATRIVSQYLETSLLAKAEELSKKEAGIYQFHLSGSSYTGGDVPTGSAVYRPATVYVRSDNSTCVVLYDSTRIWTNYLSGSEWLGWESEALQSDLAKYLPLTGGKLTGDLIIQNKFAYSALKNSARECGSYLAEDGAFGLYDTTNSKWLLRSDSNGTIHTNRPADDSNDTQIATTAWTRNQIADRFNANKVLIDLTDTSKYNESTYYPVYGTRLGTARNYRLTCTAVLYSSGIPSWSTHEGGFFATVDIMDCGLGWGSRTNNTIILDNDYKFVSSGSYPIRYHQLTNSSTPVFYVRGGGKYNFYADYVCTWTLATNEMTISEETLKPQTSVLSTEEYNTHAIVLEHLRGKLDRSGDTMTGKLTLDSSSTKSNINLHLKSNDRHISLAADSSDNKSNAGIYDENNQEWILRSASDRTVEIPHAVNITGNLSTYTSEAKAIRNYVGNTNRNISVEVHSNGNAGLYDNTNNNWLLWSDQGGNGVNVPNTFQANKLVTSGLIQSNAYNCGLTMGAQNETYCHMYADKPFYFNKDILINGKYTTVASAPSEIVSVYTFEKTYGTGSTPADYGMITIYGESRPNSWVSDTYYHIVNHEGKSYNGWQTGSSKTINWKRNLTPDDFVVTGSASSATLTINLD